MAPPVALITGTSSGIGLVSAVALAQAGLTVVATMRDPAKDGPLQAAAEAAGVKLDVRQLDVVDAASSKACVDGVLADHGSIDVLVNNAGAGHVGTLEQLTDDDLRQVMELDFLGGVRLTRLVLPIQRAAGGGRVISVTSVGGIVGQPFNDAYCAAKFATEGLMEALAPVAARFGTHVCVVEPGAVASEFIANLGFSNAGASTDPDAPEDVYAGLFAAYIARATASFSAAQDAQEVAAVIVAACTEENPKFRYQTGDVSRMFVGLRLSDFDGSSVQGQTSSWLG